MMAWTFEDFRSHVVRGSLKRSTYFGNVLIGLDFNLLGSPEVCDFDGTIFSDKNVRTFEVSVNDEFLMQVVKPSQNMFTKSGSFRLTQFSISINVILKTAVLY